MLNELAFESFGRVAVAEGLGVGVLDQIVYLRVGRRPVVDRRVDRHGEAVDLVQHAHGASDPPCDRDNERDRQRDGDTHEVLNERLHSDAELGLDLGEIPVDLIELGLVDALLRAPNRPDDLALGELGGADGVEPVGDRFDVGH